MHFLVKLKINRKKEVLIKLWLYFFFCCVKGKYLFRTCDLCGRRETPAGGRDRGDPAGALAPRRLPEPPGAQINTQFNTAVNLLVNILT
jgi:hypothetical protein